MRVSLNWVSVAFSGAFFIDLAMMGFKAYLSEVMPFFDDASSPHFTAEAIAALNASSARETLAWLQHHYNGSTFTGAYNYDAHERIDISRKLFPSTDAATSNSIVASLACGLYLPTDMHTALPEYLRHGASTGDPSHNKSSFARVWSHTLASAPHAVTGLWSVDGNDIEPHNSSSTKADDVQTIYCIYALARYSLAWLVGKWVYRLVFFLGVSWLAWTGYYAHVRALCRSLSQYHDQPPPRPAPPARMPSVLSTWTTSTGSQNHNVCPLLPPASPLRPPPAVVRYEVIVGDPTSTIVSHPLVCIWMVCDYWACPEHAGQAAQRVAQMDSLWFYVLGSLYISRCVWMAYGTLVATNYVLKRCNVKAQFTNPLSPTILEVASYIYGGIASHSMLRWHPVLSFFQLLFNWGVPRNPQGDCDRVECLTAFIGYSLVLAMLPLALGFPSCVLTLPQRVKHLWGAKNTSPSFPTSRNINAAFAFNDLKHRFVLHLLQRRAPHLRGECTCSGGSIYHLFALSPQMNAQLTMSQRGGDCYIIGYDAADRVATLSRVSLLAQVDFGAKRGHVRINVGSVAPFAVGSLDVRHAEAFVGGRRKRPSTDNTTTVVTWTPGQSQWIL